MNYFTVRVSAFFAVVLILAAGAAAAETSVGIFTYHTHPPFVTGKGQGLTYDLARYLSDKSDGRYAFKVSEMSRPRLNKSITKEQSAIVPWVSPVWFGDKEETKHTWTAGALMTDGNAVVTRSDTALDYNGPASIDGMVLGGLKGHRYSGLDDYIEQSASTRRVDADSHTANFRKLLNKQTDVMLIPKSGALFVIKQKQIEDQVYISPTPHSSYARRVMVLAGQGELKAYLDSILAGLDDDPAWKEIMSAYQ